MTPQRTPDPEGDKRRAVRLAASAAHRATVADSTWDNAIRFASDAGASLRELEAATGLSHITIKRIVDRERSGIEAT